MVSPYSPLYARIPAARDMVAHASGGQRRNSAQIFARMLDQAPLRAKGYVREYTAIEFQRVHASAKQGCGLPFSETISATSYPRQQIVVKTRTSAAWHPYRRRLRAQRMAPDVRAVESLHSLLSGRYGRTACLAVGEFLL